MKYVVLHVPPCIRYGMCAPITCHSRLRLQPWQYPATPPDTSQRRSERQWSEAGMSQSEIIMEEWMNKLYSLSKRITCSSIYSIHFAEFLLIKFNISKI